MTNIRVQTFNKGEPEGKAVTNPITKRDKYKRTNSKGAEGKALHKPGVCEAKHAKHKNTRVQNSKEDRGASTAQTRRRRNFEPEEVL